MKTAVITGANRGIGLELTRQLKERGVSVFAACRKPSDKLAALGVTVIDNVDVTDDASVKRLADAAPEQLDLLINNAGILNSETLSNLNFDSMRQQFEVNSLGPLRVTNALRGKLGNPSKVAIITSRMGSVADNTSGSRYGYRMSKAAVNMAGVSLAHDLKPDGIAVAILHPGYVRTEMTGNSGLIDADESAAGLLARIDELNAGNSGTFWHQNGEVLPW